jgi:hypothetical protein
VLIDPWQFPTKCSTAFGETVVLVIFCTKIFPLPLRSLYDISNKRPRIFSWRLNNSSRRFRSDF